MWVDRDTYNFQAAADFEDETPDPFQPARDALQFARDTAAPWQPAKWAQDAADFARSTAPGMGDVQRSGQPEQPAEPAPAQEPTASIGDALGNAGQSIGGAAGAVGQAIGAGLQTAPQPSTSNEGNLLQRIGAIATQYGLDPNVAKAIGITEGGLNGAVGDNGQSFGIFQFYKGGQLANFAKSLGVDLATAGKYATDNPEFAADWALRPGGYLGDAIRRGVEKGLSGSDLATFAQRTGQVSVSPERAGQNYARAAGDVRGADQPDRGQAPYSFPVAGYSGKDVPLHWGSNSGGTDLFAAEGTPVVAMRGGKVISSSSDSIGGNAVLIQGDDGNQYYYAHLYQTPAVKNGQTVAAGDYLGGVGDTGNAKGTGAHLHMGIGPSIVNGAGPQGGTGGDFNAVGLLRNTLAQAGKGAGDILGNVGRTVGVAAGAVGSAFDQATAPRSAPDMSGVVEPGQRPNPGVDAGRDPGFAWKAAQPGMGDVQRSSATGEAPSVGDMLGRAGEGIGDALGGVGRAVEGVQQRVGVNAPNISDDMLLSANTDPTTVPDPGKLPGVEGLGTMLREQTRGSIVGQMIDPYTDEDAIARAKADHIAAPSFEMLVKSGMTEAKAARAALQINNLVMGMSGEPIRSAGRGLGKAANAAGDAAPTPVPTTPDAAPRAAADVGMPPPAPGNGARANAILTEMYTPAHTGPSLPDGGKAMDAITLHLFNQNMPLERLQEAAAKAKGLSGAGKLQANEMAATLNRMNASGTAERKLQSGLAPVLRAVSDSGTTSDLRNYLTHRQNIDTAAALDNPDRVFSGGLSATDSREGIQAMAQQMGTVKFAQLEADASKAVAFQKSMWDRKLESGLIDQETHDFLATRYPFYTPTKILDYLRDPSKVATGTKINVNDPGIRAYTIEGTAKARQDPLLSIVNGAYETEALAAKNETFQGIIRMRDIVPGMDKVLPEMPKGYTPTKNEITISGFIDGEKHTLLVPKDMQNAFERTTRDPIPGLQQAMTLYKAMITSRNPVFLVSNALNDMGSYVIRASAREGGPQSLPRVTKALFDAYKDAFTGLGTANYGPKTTRFLEGGGAQFGFFQRSEENARKTVLELARRNAFVVKNKSDTLRLIKDLVLLKPVEAIGARIELAPRVAATELARARGVGGAEAIVAGRSITMDFAVGGDLSKLVNQYVPFFNVGMQAPAQVVRAYRENPKAFVATAAALLAAPTVAAEAWNRSDPQRAKDYEDVPDYLKSSGQVIMLPNATYTDANGNIHPQFIFMPTREFSSFVMLTRQAAVTALGEKPKAWEELLGSTLQSISPVQGSGLGEMAGQLNPVGLSTATQLYANKDFFTGAMIGTERKNKSASPLSQAISSGMGEVAAATGMGGTPQPSQVEWATQDIMGGVGRSAIGASKLGSPDQANAGPGATPIVGGFVGKFLRGQTGQRLEDAQQDVMAPEVKKALKAAGITTNFGPVSRSANGVNLTMTEQERYQALANGRVDEYVRELLAEPDWSRLDAPARQRVIERTVQHAREAAKAEVLQGISEEEFRQRRVAARSGA